ncbi:probable tRNA N6-adenosine threonylcarbamoyltransferase, mitochondrial [Ornithorhynchus anatinus]|uniref:probable tRNA N6-adenosine threonylcarbamoyltransferase, mitochondrial n=1 Tax=Ornithorhynchus anatinus TaxID=9258 RepID=UPI0019D4EDF3|nr:probable tRNA N6-adenosine threonylcarbamoyltransferase, mitochondrial [Ornithorhynchus anatinus]
MEAHALTVRLTHQLPFPFLALLLSGGHCLLAVVRGVTDFLLLGETLDIAPGDMLDKVARRLTLAKHPDCSAVSGGRAIELLAGRGDAARFYLPLPLAHRRTCHFSFCGLQTATERLVARLEKEEGLEAGQILASAPDVAAAVQHQVACHVAEKTQRAILFCRQRGLLPQGGTVLVAAGGVASNQLIRAALAAAAQDMDSTLLCPPPHLCTDNGVMVAWNGLERLRAGVGVYHSTAGIRYQPRCPLGVDISEQVAIADIKVPRFRMKI